MRSINIAVGVAPGIISGTGDGDFFLKKLVIRLEVFVGERPVNAYPVLAIDTKI
jgi:hypothetical protein